MRQSIASFNTRAIAVAIGLIAANWSFGAHAQSLLNMVEAARAYDAAYLADVAGAQAARATAKQGKAGVLPQIALQAQRARNTVHLDTAPNNTTTTNQVGIVASQSLYSATNIANFGKAKQGEMAADVQLRAAEQALLVRVAQAYFNVLTAQDEFASLKASKKAAEQQLEAAKRNFEVGNTTITDTREAQAQFDSIAAQEIASENNLRVLELALAQVTGLQYPKPYRLENPEMPPLPSGDIEQWVDTAKDSSATVAAAQIALTNAGYDLDAAKGGHLPTLDLTLGYYRNGTSATHTASNVASYKPTSQIALKFNMPLYAGAAVSNGVDAAVAKQAQARSNLDKALREVTNQVKSAYLGLQSGMSQTKALEAALASSQNALDANKLGYEVGVRINIDVLNAQTNVFKTQAALARARYEVLLGGLQLRLAAGTLSIDDLIALNKLMTP